MCPESEKALTGAFFSVQLKIEKVSPLTKARFMINLFQSYYEKKRVINRRCQNLTESVHNLTETAENCPDVGQRKGWSYMEQEIEVLMQGYQFRKFYEKKFEVFMNRYDLRKIDVEILTYLYFCGERNTASDIQRLGLFTKGHISQSLERLNRANLVQTEHDMRDRRIVHISAGKDALPIIQEARKLKQEVFEQVFRGITEEEKKVLNEVAKKVWNNMDEALNNP